MENKGINKVLEPINGSSVVDKTISRIIEAISDGRFGMGEKLPNEYELIKDLEISRNSLREAMRVLSTLGVVEIKRGDGTYVCDQVNPSVFDSIIYGLVFDISTSSELIELRRALDEIMLKLAIDKADDNDIAELRDYLELMEIHIKNEEFMAAGDTDYNFHIKIVEIGRNKLLYRIVKGVYQFFKVSIYRNIEAEEKFSHATQYHKEILDLIVTKDKSRVEEVIANSLDSWGYNFEK
ncbi:FadR/GntR family transcriptional regulator [Clostridium grantii]|uniref:DNA-binding transcriptional regulator, FadR family n=1 Tax=Clostridium grantii DSM 8605 TaxID=1121316 RepID=A0A1M5UA09_9CLOT|nr:FadR/GntR family transcriptional regulator [Clostridium grantii]SHH59799.1 DNA-binding transcriptional regulator, FadR family [Clostridium grantii DSM 8605]